MGFVEVGGNGSVVWFAQNDEGSAGTGHPGGAFGKDENPKRGAKPTAQFTILINNEPARTIDLDSGKVRILWGHHHAANVPPDNGGFPMDVNRVAERFSGIPRPNTPAQKP